MRTAFNWVIAFSVALMVTACPAIPRSLMTNRSVIAREGTTSGDGATGAVTVFADGSFVNPGVSICPATGQKWDLSDAGVVEVTVSNCSERTEMIHATVCGKDVSVDKGAHHSALTPPHAVRTIPIQIAEAFYVTDEPVKLTGMNGKVAALKDLPDYRETRCVDVFECHGESPHKTSFAVLDVRTAFAARKPQVIPAKTFFPFVDKYGQFKHGEWKGKIHSDEEFQRVRAREEKWLEENAEGPVADVDQYGGWLKGPQLKTTGFFRTEKVDGKWWLVDPEGRIFFSLGIDCIYPGESTTIDGRDAWFEWMPKAGDPDSAGRWYDKSCNQQKFVFTQANLVRKYGKDWEEQFKETLHRRFKAWGINTLGNWSYVYKRGRTPYAATIDFSSRTRYPTDIKPKGRAMPDVYSEQFAKDLAAQVKSLKERIKDDPWCVGIFVDNELGWNSVTNEEEVAEKYFSTVRSLLKAELPNHLYLGCRFDAGGEAAWRAAARHCDVVSFNFYERLPTKDLPTGAVDKPLIVGEFHFGALDRGMFHGGCARTFDQNERAQCFKNYVNACLDHPRFVGCHWFQYHDQPLIGRGGGGEAENFNDGFVSVCDFPHPELVEACRETAAQMYQRRYK